MKYIGSNNYYEWNSFDIFKVFHLTGWIAETTEHWTLHFNIIFTGIWYEMCVRDMNQSMHHKNTERHKNIRSNKNNDQKTKHSNLINS